MTGPALAIQFILLITWFGLILLLFIYTIIKRRSLKRSIPSGLLFLILVFLSGYIYYEKKQSENKAAKKFWGYYKLEMLDRKKCENCKVRLRDGYRYEILVNNKVVGKGKWHLETAIDIPGPFLKVDFGPNYVVWEHDRLIEYIDRTQDQ
jgi:energy-coupling factor transporter transmembrane protein EcfT